MNLSYTTPPDMRDFFGIVLFFLLWFPILSQVSSRGIPYRRSVLRRSDELTHNPLWEQVDEPAIKSNPLSKKKKKYASHSCIFKACLGPRRGRRIGRINTFKKFRTPRLIR